LFWINIRYCSPGTNIPTTINGSSYILGFGGTSAAAPHVSGVAALILSVNPKLKQKSVKDIIELTARKIRQGTGQRQYTYTTGRPNDTWNL